MDFLGVVGEENPLDQLVESTISEENAEINNEVDDLELSHVEPRHWSRVHDLLRNYSLMWSSELGEIKTSENHIQVQLGMRSIAQAPYRAGQKALEAEQSEVD